MRRKYGFTEDELEDVITRYDDITKDIRNDYKSNNDRFCKKFEKIVESMHIRPVKRRNATKKVKK